ncbi:hypothetical protein ACRALDRAFT_211354 [Sodiomyces alcalophilus JCM 7366]|uniref:uncharacterized protein n=1 Tax=Sodiomyces alcalophilus JCM 7366 TaxID=591952 RepID=UPI0039B4583D
MELNYLIQRELSIEASRINMKPSNHKYLECNDFQKANENGTLAWECPRPLNATDCLPGSGAILLDFLPDSPLKSEHVDKALHFKDAY